VVRKRPSTNSEPKARGRTGPGRETVYFPSLSGQTFVYKGMLTTPQLKAFYLDLQERPLTSALGIVHSRSLQHVPVLAVGAPVRRVAT